MHGDHRGPFLLPQLLDLMREIITMVVYANCTQCSTSYFQCQKEKRETGSPCCLYCDHPPVEG
jgi:hypothetical protein